MELRFRTIRTSPSGNTHTLMAYVWSDKQFGNELTWDEYNEICYTARCGEPYDNGTSFMSGPAVKAYGHRAIVYQQAGRNV